MSKQELKDHPIECPNCGTIGSVMYERIALSRGEYVCDDCGWGMDALTGEITNSGEPCEE